MKSNTIAFSAASVLLTSLIIIGTFHTSIVSALTATTTDATSTASDTTSALASPTSASSTTSATDASSTSATPPAQTQVAAQSQANPCRVPASRRSSSCTSSARNTSTTLRTARRRTPSPAIPKSTPISNKPNAPIPSHAGLTWVSTSGMDAYDTPSGDLQIGDYAQEADGSHQQCPRLHLHRRNLQRSHRCTYRDLENRPNRSNFPITYQQSADNSPSRVSLI